MDPLGALHVGLSLLALGSGLAVIRMRKGTPRHAQVGWVYLTSMVGVNGTALLIYRLLGTFGPFHMAALASLVTLAGGVVTTRTRRPQGRWKEAHAYWMGGSYVGLLAATAAEAASRVPQAPFWGAVVVATMMVLVVGIGVLRVTVPRALGRPARR